MEFAPGECDFVSKLSSFSPILAVVEMNIGGEEEEIKTEQTTGIIRLVKVD